MASKEVEREIDDWVESCPLKRHSIVNRRRVMSTKEMDREWDRLVNEALKKENVVYL